MPQAPLLFDSIGIEPTYFSLLHVFMILYRKSQYRSVKIEKLQADVAFTCDMYFIIVSFKN